MRIVLSTKNLRLVIVLLVVALWIILVFLANKNKTDNARSSSVLPSKLSSLNVWLDENISETPKNLISKFIEESKSYKMSAKKEGSDVIISNIKSGAKCQQIYKEYLVPVVNFGSLKETVSSSDLKNLFTRNSADNEFKKAFYLTSDRSKLESYFEGSIVSDGLQDIDELINNISVDDIALIPFDKLNPKLKVLKVDSKSILDKGYNDTIENIYPTTPTFLCSDSVSEIAPITNWAKTNIPASNRDTKKMKSLVMTGVTAISRGVELVIKKLNDPMYPARGVMDELSKADITHVSSENPLFDSCDPQPEGLILCGKTQSIASLKAIGTDIVDLNGNHQGDYGQDKFLETIQHLEDAGFQYFGGGRNEEEAAKALIKPLQENYNLAFLGYAYFDSLNGPLYRNLALKDRPGANFYDEEKLKASIAEAKKKANFVIIDYQFTETYSSSPTIDQINVFHNTIDWGADLVVGVQAHQPQKIEFYNGKTIFYGLGNFFFDQMWSEETRQGIIPRFTFYDGKLISIELLTTLLYNYAQPRFVTGEERNIILESVLPANIK